MIGSAMQPKDLPLRARLNENTVLRSSCPMSYTLEMVRDSWSLLIVRDTVYFGKKTFGEFGIQRRASPATFSRTGWPVSLSKGF